VQDSPKLKRPFFTKELRMVHLGVERLLSLDSFYVLQILLNSRIPTLRLFGDLRHSSPVSVSNKYIPTVQSGPPFPPDRLGYLQKERQGGEGVWREPQGVHWGVYEPRLSSQDTKIAS
ncbi:hypothetical protein SK128_007171, partial [Halocaridina rubra]